MAVAPAALARATLPGAPLAPALAALLPIEPPAPALPMPPVIRVAVENRPPLVYVQQNEGDGAKASFDGFLVQLWRLLLDDANVTTPYTYWVPPTDVPGGRKVTERNGTTYWTGESVVFCCG
jgi:hypothetical protein